MPTVFVSPCGTSILTNQTEDALRKLLIRTANCREDELSFEDKATIDQHLQERGQLIKSADIALNIYIRTYDRGKENIQ